MQSYKNVQISYGQSSFKPLKDLQILEMSIRNQRKKSNEMSILFNIHKSANVFIYRFKSKRY